MKKFSLKLLLVLGANLLALPGFAEYVVVAHPDVDTTLSRQDVERIFLAKAKTLPDGAAAAPVNQQEGSAIRVAFDSQVVGKSESQMKSYWAKLIFTGKAVPLKVVSGDKEVLAFVASQPGAIGYVDAASTDDSVRVLFSF